MITTVQFGKDKYHLQGPMINWLNENIGVNPRMTDWVWTAPTDELSENCVWAIQSMFGNTFFYFKNQADAVAFMLKWK